MKKRFVSMALTLAMLLSLAPVLGIDASAATSYVSDATDSRIDYMLANIQRQNFSGSGINVSQAQNYMRHFMFTSKYAAIGGSGFDYPNSGAYTWHVDDGTYSKDIWGSKGCFAYSCFVSQVVYANDVSCDKVKLSSYGYTGEGLKTMLQRYAQAGEHLRMDDSHSVAFISGDDEGFYCFSYCGDSNPVIRLDYWTYSAFVSYYSSCDIFIYNVNTADNNDVKCSNGHSYGSTYSVSVTPTESSTGKISCYCTVCGASKDVTLPKLNTDDYSYSVISAASCTASGKGRYTWKTTQYGTFSFDVTLAALPHNYCYAVSKAPTETEEGQLKGTCSSCKGTVTVTLPKFNYTDYTYDVIGEPTCTQGCVGRYTWNDTQYGNVYFDKQLPALGHGFFDSEVITAPTADSTGLLRSTCFRCGETKDVTLPVLSDADYTCTTDGKASCTEGVTLHYTWKVEEYGSVSFDRVIPPSGHSYENGICTVCGAVDPYFTLSNPFVDVSKSANYYNAVLWAYYHKPQQITGGFDATHFVPNNPCSRAQVVTFLWRAAGCPEPETVVCPFSDVSTLQANGNANPYYKAILWASETGITKGYAGGVFKPNDTVTRAQFVTFLWRFEGEPATTGSIDGFGDAESISAAYQTAVAWAVENGVTMGYGDGTFRPNSTCTRWAVVLFMYRDMEK